MDMMREDGGQTVHQVLFNLAEYQIRNGRDGYRWDGEAFVGGDINRLWIKSEGEGVMHQGVDSAEVQALFSHAIGPYYNLQAGVRQDIRPAPARTYATIGFEGLAPYQFETEGALFLSTKGDLLGRLEGWYDQRLTQRLVLQPRVELNFSAQDVPEDRYGAGLVDAELGLRLRYEVRREFAPYIGVSYERKTGKTADFAKADGQDSGLTSFVIGVRAWF
jgi:copper resistance protein B